MFGDIQPSAFYNASGTRYEVKLWRTERGRFWMRVEKNGDFADDQVRLYDTRDEALIDAGVLIAALERNVVASTNIGAFEKKGDSMPANAIVQLTVNDLVAALRTLDGDCPVYLYSDAEGNRVEPLDHIAVDDAPNVSAVYLVPKHTGWENYR